MSLFLPQDSPPPSVDNELVIALKYGDPTRGWEGDPRLELAWNREEQRFELWRQEDDGHWYMVCRNRPGQRVADWNLIARLVEIDRNRGYNPEKAVNEHNAKIEQDIIKAREPEVEQAADKLRWALKKDIN